MLIDEKETRTVRKTNIAKESLVKMRILGKRLRRINQTR